jgi:hypothetical protein
VLVQIVLAGKTCEEAQVEPPYCVVAPAAGCAALLPCCCCCWCLLLLLLLLLLGWFRAKLMSLLRTCSFSRSDAEYAIAYSTFWCNMQRLSGDCSALLLLLQGTTAASPVVAVSNHTRNRQDDVETFWSCERSVWVPWSGGD